MGILTKISGNKTTLLVMSSSEYNKTVTQLAKAAAKGNVCYVTANKTFDSLKEKFSKAKVNLENIVFIDAISKSIKNVEDQTKGCYFISSPGALAELNENFNAFAH